MSGNPPVQGGKTDSRRDPLVPSSTVERQEGSPSNFGLKDDGVKKAGWQSSGCAMNWIAPAVQNFFLPGRMPGSYPSVAHDFQGQTRGA